MEIKSQNISYNKDFILIEAIAVLQEPLKYICINFELNKKKEDR